MGNIPDIRYKSWSKKNLNTDISQTPGFTLVSRGANVQRVNLLIVPYLYLWLFSSFDFPNS